MDYLPFSAINTAFRKRLSDRTLYTGQRYSWLKVFQHALSYAMNGWKHKLLPPFFERGRWYALLVHTMRSVLRGQRAPRTWKRVVFLDPGRAFRDTDGQERSMYMDTLRKALPAGRAELVSRKREATAYADRILDAPSWRMFPDRTERNMLRELHGVFRTAAASGQLDDRECRYLDAAMQVFLEQFCWYYRAWKHSAPECIVFIAHYHQEGIIAAARELGIRAVEVQHGLISASDLYYVYPPELAQGSADALFPDLLFVYGPYWKRILEKGAEWRPGQVIVAGDYLSRSTGQAAALPKENLVLVAAQKRMSSAYIPYLRSLTRQMAAHPDWKLLIKTHPLEDRMELYEALASPQVEIAGKGSRLDECLQRARIQVSIYSTTFYDALGFDVLNLALQDAGQGEEYAAEMVALGVALPLLSTQDPVQEYAQWKASGAHQLQRSEVYAPFSPHIVDYLSKKS